MTQKQKIGRSKGARRICLWNRAMIKNGFEYGQPICIAVENGARLMVYAKAGPRKVSKVMNHGNELPVIDLKETKSLDFSFLGEVGDKVVVSIQPGKITISKDEGGEG